MHCYKILYVLLQGTVCIVTRIPLRSKYLAVDGLLITSAGEDPESNYLTKSSAFKVPQVSRHETFLYKKTKTYVSAWANAWLQNLRKEQGQKKSRAFITTSRDCSFQIRTRSVGREWGRWRGVGWEEEAMLRQWSAGRESWRMNGRVMDVWRWLTEVRWFADGCFLLSLWWLQGVYACERKYYRFPPSFPVLQITLVRTI